MRAVAIALAAALLATGCLCAPGQASCEAQCADLTSDVAHCGACGNRCARGQLCVDGRCRGARLTDTECSDDAGCDDRVGCNGIERCVSGVCRLGDPIACDDGVDCTVESCREPGVCVSVPDDGRCPGASRCTVMSTSEGCAP